MMKVTYIEKMNIVVVSIDAPAVSKEIKNSIETQFSKAFGCKAILIVGTFDYIDGDNNLSDILPVEYLKRQREIETMIRSIANNSKARLAQLTKMYGVPVENLTQREFHTYLKNLDDAYNK